VLCDSPSICTLLQCTNLGGMEQSAYFVMENVPAKWRVATPRSFGEGKRRVLGVDGGARDTVYRGKFGLLSQSDFVQNCRERAGNCSHTWITGTDVACLRAARKLGLPTLLGHHYHHFDGALNVVRWKLFYELLVKGHVQVTYPTDFTRNEGIRLSPWLVRCSHVVRYHFPVHSVTLVEKAEAKQRLGFESDAVVIGNAGWLIARKRWDVFLETAALVIAKCPQAKFVVCGGGPLERSLKNHAARLGIAGSVRFTGWCDDLSDFYRAFDVLLFNSDFDALGRTPGEAMGYGAIPVASVSYGGLSELVEHTSNGFLISSHDADLLAGYVMQLAESPSLREDFSAAGKKVLEQRYSAEAATGFYRDWFGC
jgi:glycosyltransferase involved in cell wall biosynthesis